MTTTSTLGLSKPVAKPQLAKPGNKETYKWDIVWINVIGFTLVHALFMYGWYLFFTKQVKLSTVVWTAALTYIGSISATVGFHRLFSHRSFKTNVGLRAALLTAFSMVGQGSLWSWVRDHRLHHKYSDTDADPYNSSRGLFFSHIGWLMVRKQPEVKELGRVVDMSDMNADSMIMFQKRYYKTIFILLSVIIPTLTPYFLWSEDLWVSFVFSFVMRFTFVENGTWCVNSLAHKYGTKPYTKDIQPVESALVSIISSGEGWHNYHHSFPWDYRAAELGMPLNFSATFIDFCAALGWAWDLKAATPEMIRHRVTKRGDGSHRKYKKQDDKRLKGDADCKYKVIIADNNNNEWTKDDPGKVCEGLRRNPRRKFNDNTEENNDYNNKWKKDQKDEPDEDYEQLKRDAERRFNDDTEENNDYDNEWIKDQKDDPDEDYEQLKRDAERRFKDDTEENNDYDNKSKKDQKDEPDEDYEQLKRDAERRFNDDTDENNDYDYE